MKLTENLKKLIKEAVDDSFKEFNGLSERENKTDEEILMEASVDSISFEGEEIVEGRMYKLNIIIDGRALHIDGLLFEAEDKSRISWGAYQLHISLPSNLRQKGIATKLYMAFLKTVGDIVSLYDNRVGTYAAKVNKSESYDSAPDKILLTIARNANANIEKLYSGEEEVGFIVSLN